MVDEAANSGDCRRPTEGDRRDLSPIVADDTDAYHQIDLSQVLVPIEGGRVCCLAAGKDSLSIAA